MTLTIKMKKKNAFPVTFRFGNRSYDSPPSPMAVQKHSALSSRPPPSVTASRWLCVLHKPTPGTAAGAHLCGNGASVCTVAALDWGTGRPAVSWSLVAAGKQRKPHGPVRPRPRWVGVGSAREEPRTRSEGGGAAARGLPGLGGEAPRVPAWLLLRGGRCRTFVIRHRGELKREAQSLLGVLASGRPP